jgi:hypothetical protein
VTDETTVPAEEAPQDEPAAAATPEVAMATADRKAPNPTKLVDGVHPYPLSQPLPAKTITEQQGAFRVTGSVEASRLEDTAAAQAAEYEAAAKAAKGKP